MRKVIMSVLLFFLLILNAASFALNQNNLSHSSPLFGLANEFNKHQQNLSPSTHDMTMGYAGEDIIKTINLPLTYLS